jgi:hypothetical protein
VDAIEQQILTSLQGNDIQGKNKVRKFGSFAMVLFFLLFGVVLKYL